MKLQPYIDYKESEIEWLKRIPKYWEVNRIKDIAFLKSGDTVTSSQLIDPPGFPVYGGNGFRGYFEDYNLEGHYILIGRQGALCGNINLAKGKFWASEHAIVVHSTKKWEMIWFSELLSSMNLNQYSLSAAQPGLSVETIRQLKIPFPPLPEQTRIAKYLDRQTQLIDRKIELLQKKRDYYEELKQALINETVCRGLDKNAPLKDSGVEWIGKVPAHWEVKRLKDVGYLFSGLSGKSAPDFDQDNEPRNRPYITFVSIAKSRYVDFSEVGQVRISEHEQQNKVRKNDILFLMSSEGYEDIGKSALVTDSSCEVYLNSFCKGFRITNSNIQARFLNFLLSANSYRSKLIIEGKGFTRINLKISKINDFDFVLPPIEEQSCISSFLDSKLTRMGKIQDLIKTQINTLQELRKTLINDVVTGKVRVPETD